MLLYKLDGKTGKKVANPELTAKFEFISGVKNIYF